MISFVFNEFLYRPLFNVLIFLYNTIAFGDTGIAIILLTVLIRLALSPLSRKSIRSQKALQEIQPKVRVIQEKYKNNKEEQAKQLMAFYKENKVNPLSGCLPILIQLPILIALYRVFLKGLDPQSLSLLYSFVGNPLQIDPTFLNVVSLAVPNKILAVLAGVTQFFQAKMIMPKTSLPNLPKKSDEFTAQLISKQTLYFLPLLTLIISWKLPAGLALYWAATTVFTIIEQFVIMRPKQ